MKRIHILLRLFVLAALTFSFGETVWASMCASMSMVAVSDPAASDHAMQDMPGMPADGGQQDGDADPWCPLGPLAVAQGCLTAASLPAVTAEPFAPADVSTADVVFVAAANDLLYDATLFHPPRA